MQWNSLARLVRYPCTLFFFFASSTSCLLAGVVCGRMHQYLLGVYFTKVRALPVFSVAHWSAGPYIPYCVFYSYYHIMHLCFSAHLCRVERTRQSHSFLFLASRLHPQHLLLDVGLLLSLDAYFHAHVFPFYLFISCRLLDNHG